jgi:large subunit ribosomal protein L10
MPNLKNQQEVKNLTEKFKTMKGLIFTQYRGLTVVEISELRSKLRAFNSEYAVVKNTLSEIALENVGIKMNDSLSGPTALVIENDDIISPAKIVVEFAKTHAQLKIKSGFIEGKSVDVSFVEKLSTIASKEVLVAKLLSSMNAPITRFVNALAANIRRFVTVLDAIAKKQAV